MLRFAVNSETKKRVNWKLGANMVKYPYTDDIKRRWTMSRVKGKNTSIEILLRKALWHSGIRYRVNYKKLPGTPDIVIPKYRIAIFCDGEFWHGKSLEKERRRIQNNHDYWVSKIERNIKRDQETNRKLTCMGWTVVRFWGVEIRKHTEDCVNEVKDAIFQNKMDNVDNFFYNVDEIWADE